MIRSFADSDTEMIFSGFRPRKIPIQTRERGSRKLILLNAVEELRELRTPPGNRLEKLNGDHEGQHSIRINDQWRICFIWREGNAYEVEITDYHS
ncbi:MAG: type II toxin-antitoxin system RelE/ParE family toxin [Anaerolineales bacterium]|nr:type II toxin-antitoxin system RelE/ParE family toxin [Anaerolineales bacterium]